jgi:hypothetical protein
MIFDVVTLIATLSEAMTLEPVDAIATGGVRAQYQIRETRMSALARPVNTPEIVVGLVTTKMVGGRFHDPENIALALNGFATMIEEIVALARR